jgi:trehalose 6-phosphate phosphatase
VLRPSLLRARSLALLIDVDGTLVPFAPTPQAVVIDAGLRRLLDELLDVLDGALALVSGRSLENLDWLFPNNRFALVGSHGAVLRRAPDAQILSCVPHAEALGEARDTLLREVARDPRLLLEDKGISVALHYRRAPDRENWVRARVSTLAHELGPDYQVQWGAAVAELRPAGFDKGTAVKALMTEPPFAGRCPVYLGDDDTDIAALRAVAELDGAAIAVGPRLLGAGYPHLESPSQVREVLLGLSVALRRSGSDRRE